MRATTAHMVEAQADHTTSTISGISFLRHSMPEPLFRHSLFMAGLNPRMGVSPGLGDAPDDRLLQDVLLTCEYISA
jgi:hypothetical protein